MRKKQGDEKENVSSLKAKKHTVCDIKLLGNTENTQVSAVAF